MKMTIGGLARETHCKIVTIRFYEQAGLLQAPERSRSNFRIYSTPHIQRLRFIKSCRDLDISLKDIRALLALQNDPTQGCHEVRILLKDHIHQLDQRVTSLLELKDDLARLDTVCNGEGSIDSCEILSRLAEM